MGDPRFFPSVYDLLDSHVDHKRMKMKVIGPHILYSGPRTPLRKITHHFTINKYRRLFFAGVNLYIHIACNNKARLNTSFYIYYLSFSWLYKTFSYKGCF